MMTVIIRMIMTIIVASPAPPAVPNDTAMPDDDAYTKENDKHMTSDRINQINSLCAYND